MCFLICLKDEVKKKKKMFYIKVDISIQCCRSRHFIRTEEGSGSVPDQSHTHVAGGQGRHTDWENVCNNSGKLMNVIVNKYWCGKGML